MGRLRTLKMLGDRGPQKSLGYTRRQVESVREGLRERARSSARSRTEVGG